MRYLKRTPLTAEIKNIILGSAYKSGIIGIGALPQTPRFSALVFPKARLKKRVAKKYSP